MIKLPSLKIPFIKKRDNFEKLISLNRRPTFTFLIIVLVVLLLSPSFYFYNQNRKLQRFLSDPSLISKAEADKIIAEVGRLMTLPEGEYPTVATVADLEQLKDKPFFNKAKQGDKVLIYPNAKKAILYDPVTDKIIDITPVNFEPTATPTSAVIPTVPPQPSPTLENNLKVILYNGTNITGLTKNYEELLKEKIPNVTVTDKDVAKKRDYPETLLVDIKGNKKEQAELLANILEIKLESMPNEESASPSADFLIILGANQK